MPKVVPDQFEKFKNDEMFKKLRQGSEIRYMAAKGSSGDRSNHLERACKLKKLEISLVSCGISLELLFEESTNTNLHSSPFPPTPTSNIFFNQLKNRLEFCSRCILNGVCVLVMGWLDACTSSGVGRLEYDEETAMKEDNLLRNQIRQYNMTYQQQQHQQHQQQQQQQKQRQQQQQQQHLRLNIMKRERENANQNDNQTSQETIHELLNRPQNISYFQFFNFSDKHGSTFIEQKALKAEALPLSRNAQQDDDGGTSKCQSQQLELEMNLVKNSDKINQKDVCTTGLRRNSTTVQEINLTNPKQAKMEERQADNSVKEERSWDEAATKQNNEAAWTDDIRAQTTFEHKHCHWKKSRIRQLSESAYVPDGMTIFPFQRGKSLVWDATCVDSFSQSKLVKSACDPGSASRAAEVSKFMKYSNLVDRFIYCHVAVETSGVLGPKTFLFLNRLGSGDSRETAWLMHCISIAIVRGNAQVILTSIRGDEE